MEYIKENYIFFDTECIINIILYILYYKEITFSLIFQIYEYLLQYRYYVIGGDLVVNIIQQFYFVISKLC
jgi:hypothetical protein